MFHTLRQHDWVDVGVGQFEPTGAAVNRHPITLTREIDCADTVVALLRIAKELLETVNEGCCRNGDREGVGRGVRFGM